MGEYGTIIDPYRVAPAQGGLDELLNFVRTRAQYGREVQANDQLQATLGFLGGQAGLPAGVNPFDVQKYQGEGLNQKVVEGDFNNRQTDFRQKQEFSQGFMGSAMQNPTLQQSQDPYTQALLAAGMNPYAAQGLSEQLGGQSQRQGELQGRIDMNNADNTAAAERAKLEWDTRRQMGAEDDKRKAEYEAQIRAQQAAGIQKWIQSGGADITGLDPRTLSGDILQMALGVAAKQKQEEQLRQERELLRQQQQEKTKMDTRPYGEPGQSMLQMYLKPGSFRGRGQQG